MKSSPADTSLPVVPETIRPGVVADLSELLAAMRRSEARAPSQVIETLQRDQLERWRQGERVPVEAYWRLLDHLGAADSDERFDLIYAEVLLRRQRGETLSLTEYQWRFPQFRQQLELLFQLESQLDDAGELAADPPAAGEAMRGPDAPVKQIAGYEILEVLGRGGMGVVYKARQPGLHRLVALKLIHTADDEVRTRFRIEAEAVAQLQHPNIVQIHEIGAADSDGGREPFMALEYIGGGSLATWLAGKPLPPSDAAALVETLARAVHYAHQRGILHRDLKPGNVLVSQVDVKKREVAKESQPAGMGSRPPLSSLCLKVTDFGLAKRLQDDATAHTQTGSIVGTPSYMAPEQAAGRNRDVGVPTDVYALGAIFYECLTGRPPFRGETPLETMEHVRLLEPLAPSRLQRGVPRDLETICLKCLQKDPAQRYPSADALADDLRRQQRGEPIRARRVGALNRFVLWCRRKPALAGTFLAATLLIAGVAVTSYLRVLFERDRYRVEHDLAIANYYQSLLGEARALRLARTPGYRPKTFARLKQAMELDTPARDLGVLRDEAVACLGDFVGLEPVAWRDIPPATYVVALAISPDAAEVALGRTDGVIALRERASGIEKQRLQGHKAGVFAMVYGGSGKLFVTADDGGVVTTWTRATGDWKAARRFQVAPSNRRNYVHAMALALSPDERRLFISSRLTPSVRVWNLESGTEEKSFEMPAKGLIHRMALSRDGQWLATALSPSASNEVLLSEVSTGVIAGRVRPGLGLVNDLVFSASGKHLACACQEGVAVYDRASLGSRFFVRGDAPNAVAFSPDEHWLAIPALEFGLVRIWNVQANREVALLKHDHEPHSIAFSHDGATLLAAGASLIVLWDLHCSGEKLALAGHDQAVTNVEFAVDGQRLLSSGGDGQVKLADPRTGRRLGGMDGFPGTVCAAMSADGDTIVTSDGAGAVATWDASSPAVPRQLMKHDHSLGKFIWNVAISPDGAWLAAVGPNGLALWPRAQAKATMIRTEKANWIRFSPDSRQIAWVNLGDGLVTRRNCADGAETSVKLDDALGSTIPYFPDGQRVLTVNKLRQIVVLDFAAQRQEFILGEVDYGEQGSFYMGRVAALTGDGVWAAIQAPSIPIWNAMTRRRLCSLPREHSVPTALAWGGNRAQLAVGTRDGGLAVWNLPALRRQLKSLGLDWEE